jgi:hypothetical protein
MNHFLWSLAALGVVCVMEYGLIGRRCDCPLLAVR